MHNLTKNCIWNNLIKIYYDIFGETVFIRLAFYCIEKKKKIQKKCFAKTSLDLISKRLTLNSILELEVCLTVH